MRLYVYNHEYNVTRQISITPSRSWGGEGALGCVLGFGALHRLPLPLEEPPQGPGETLFETARFSNEENRPLASHPSHGSLGSLYSPPMPGSENFLRPADIASPPPPPSAGPAQGEGKGVGNRMKPRRMVTPNTAFEQYFKEGEERSKEEDFVPEGKGGAAPPPPPGAGKQNAGEGGKRTQVEDAEDADG